MNNGSHLSVNGKAKDACRIYMVRHGRTMMNDSKRFRGILEVPLNEHGRKDAWRAAHNLARARISAVYTSPLCRAREVGEAIAAVAGVAEVVDAPGLLNLDYGDWHGLEKEDCAERHPDAWRRYREDPEACVCPGGEALSSAADRTVAALRDIGARHRGEAVAAVSHGVMVRLAVLRVAPQPEWEVPLETGSATVFDVLDGEISLVRLPDAADETVTPLAVPRIPFLPSAVEASA